MKFSLHVDSAIKHIQHGRNDKAMRHVQRALQLPVDTLGFGGGGPAPPPVETREAVPTASSSWPVSTNITSTVNFNILKFDSSHIKSKQFVRWVYEKLVKSKEILPKNDIASIKIEYQNFETLVDLNDNHIIANYKIISSFLYTFITIVENVYAENMEELYSDLAKYFHANKNERFRNFYDFILYIDTFIYHKIIFKYSHDDIFRNIKPLHHNEIISKIFKKKLEDTKANIKKLNNKLTFGDFMKVNVTESAEWEELDTHPVLYWRNRTTKEIRPFNKVFVTTVFPSKWTEHLDAKHDHYYWAHKEHTSTWEKPSWIEPQIPTITETNDEYYYVVNYTYKHDDANKFHIIIIYGVDMYTIPRIFLMMSNDEDCIRVQMPEYAYNMDFVTVGNLISDRISKSFMQGKFISSLFMQQNISDRLKLEAINDKKLFLEGCESYETQTNIRNKWNSNGLTSEIWSELYKKRPIFVIVGHGNICTGYAAGDIYSWREGGYRRTTYSAGDHGKKVCDVKSFTVPKNTQLISFNRSGTGTGGMGGTAILEHAIFLSASDPQKPEHYLFDDDGITRNKILPVNVGPHTPIISNCQKLYRYNDIVNDILINFNDHNGIFRHGDMGIYVFNSAGKFTDEFLQKRPIGFLKNGKKSPHMIEYIRTIKGGMWLDYQGNDFVFLERIRHERGTVVPRLSQIIEELGEGTYYILACKGVTDMQGDPDAHLTELARENSKQKK